MIALYLLAIVFANLSIVYFGPIAALPNAFLFIALDLVSRDYLHDRWQHKRLPIRMALLIAAGSLLSLVLGLLLPSTFPADMVIRVARASCIAFAASASCDALVYWMLRSQRWMIRSNGSNLVGAAVDSMLFAPLAFGVFLPWIVFGQFVAKASGGLLWSWIISKTRPKTPISPEGSKHVVREWHVW
jgi:uncharacterized PurR-regulated membrane protein YhhQ (DUF165 family)